MLTCTKTVTDETFSVANAVTLVANLDSRRSERSVSAFALFA
jgi:hypothetical protein